MKDKPKSMDTLNIDLIALFCNCCLWFTYIAKKDINSANKTTEKVNGSVPAKWKWKRYLVRSFHSILQTCSASLAAEERVGRKRNTLPPILS